MHTAQKQLKGQLAISMESHQNEMLAMGKNILVYGKVDPVEEIYRRIDAVSASALLEIANEAFDPSQLSMLIFNNQKTS
jgi:predicted Zn-dependent peptidase